MSRIMIDAGHGGHDPGAIGARSNEKTNVLKVALRLKALLEASGHTVGMTRSTDVYLTLSERARRANSWNADYFVSLHNNAARSNASGFETFAHNGAVHSRTLQFQSSVHDAIAKGMGIRDRGKKRANFAVLRETKMSSVLVEYAFIDNAADEQILINEVEKLALLTARGIINHVGGRAVAAPSTVAPPEKESGMTVSQYNELKNRLDSLENKIGTNRDVSTSLARGWEWSNKKGFLDGANPSHLMPREQLSTVLYRYNQSNDLTGTSKEDFEYILKEAYDKNILGADHSKDVATMAEYEIINLLIALVSRYLRDQDEQEDN